MSDSPEPGSRGIPAPWGRRKIAGLAALSGLVMLSLKSQAQGAAPPADAGRRRAGPENMARRIDSIIERMLQAAAATPEQQARITGIAQAALADVRPLREQLRAARARGMALLTAPTVDRAALEQLRASQMQTADALSRRAAQAFADAAEALEPQQRARLAARLQERLARQHRG